MNTTRSRPAMVYSILTSAISNNNNNYYSNIITTTATRLLSSYSNMDQQQSDNSSNSSTMPAWPAEEEYLAELDAEFAQTVFPAIFFLGVLMVAGTVGNAAVLYVYTCRMRGQGGTVTRFIQALAVFDLLSCCLAIPGEIMDMSNNFTFGRSPFCKPVRTINLFCTLSSGITLIVVAIDRYKRICCPIKPQISPSLATIIVCVAPVGALILSLPTAIIYGIRSTPTDHPHVMGMDCSIGDRYVNTAIPLAYNGVQMLLFVTGLFILIVLYILIARRIFQHEHQRLQRRRSTHMGTLKGLERKLRFPVSPSDVASSSSPATDLASPVTLTPEEQQVKHPAGNGNPPSHIFFGKVEKPQLPSPTRAGLQNSAYETDLTHPSSLNHHDSESISPGQNANKAEDATRQETGQDCSLIEQQTGGSFQHGDGQRCQDITKDCSRGEMDVAKVVVQPCKGKESAHDLENCDGDSGISTESLPACDSDQPQPVSLNHQTSSTNQAVLLITDSLPSAGESNIGQDIQNTGSTSVLSGADAPHTHLLEKNIKMCASNSPETEQKEDISEISQTYEDKQQIISHLDTADIATSSLNIPPVSETSAASPNAVLASNDPRDTCQCTSQMLAMYTPSDKGKSNETKVVHIVSQKGTQAQTQRHEASHTLSLLEKNTPKGAKSCSNFSTKKDGETKYQKLLSSSLASMTRSEGDRMTDCSNSTSGDDSETEEEILADTKNATPTSSSPLSRSGSDHCGQCSEEQNRSPRRSLRARLANSTTNLLGKLMSNEKSLSEWDATLEISDIESDTTKLYASQRLSKRKHSTPSLSISRTPSLPTDSRDSKRPEERAKRRERVEFTSDAKPCQDSPLSSSTAGGSERTVRSSTRTSGVSAQSWKRHSSGDGVNLRKPLHMTTMEDVSDSEKKVLFRHSSLGMRTSQNRMEEIRFQESQVQTDESSGGKDAASVTVDGKVSLRDRRRGSSFKGLRDLRLRRFTLRSSTPGIRRTTLILFLISLVYVVSFLPHLVMMTLKSLNPLAVSGESQGWTLASNLIIRSYFLNSVANPFIYTFLSKNFLRRVRESFSSCSWGKWRSGSKT